jgi:glycosyl-4,4'-diaponeurosporenoate acyltransferase
MARPGDRRPSRHDPVIDLPLLVTFGFWGTLIADVLGWALIHAGTGYAAHRLRPECLETDDWLLRVRPFEPAVYRRLRVRRWKDRLPEAGALFTGGISKRHLPDSLAVFVRETRRAELAHWWAVAASPVFALWNPLSGVALMVGYGVAVNAPFIAIQRHNRHRAQRLLTRRAHR